MLTIDQLAPHLAARVRKELAPGESTVWIGKPGTSWGVVGVTSVFTWAFAAAWNAG